MTKIIDIRALQGAGRSGVEVYIEGFLKEMLMDRRIQEMEAVILWVNASSEVVLPEYVYEFAEQDNIYLIQTIIPNKILNLSCSLFRWPKIDRLEGIRKALKRVERDCLEIWVLDPRPTPVSNSVKKNLVVHDLSSMKFPKFFSFRSRLWARVVRLGKEMSESDKIWAVSEFTKNEILEFNSSLESKIGVKSPIVRLESIPEDFKEEFLKDIKEKYGLNDEKILLSMSTLEPRKNVEGVIEKFLDGEFPDYERLVIAGRENRRIFNKTNYKTDPRLVFTGFVTDEEKIGLYNLANGFVCLSKYEGYGIPVKEATHFELPLILSDIPPFHEIVEDYEKVQWV